MKSPRNKTMTLTPDETSRYLARCLTEADALDADKLKDRTVFGDTFAILPRLPRQFADLLIVDPPYNLSKDFHGKKFRKTTAEEYAAYTRRWVEAVFPLLKKTASVYVCCDWQTSMIIAPILAEYFTVRNRITWQREKGRGSLHNWKNAMEDIWFLTVSDKYTFHPERVQMRRRVMAPYRKDGAPKDWEETPDGNFRNTAPSNFWDDISIPYWSMAENTDHPTQKPEKLMAKLILASSEEGDLVFDPFLGSGTTSVTAKKLGRAYLGIEQNETYCALAEKRLEAATVDTEIQGYTGGVFWERNTNCVQSKNKKP